MTDIERLKATKDFLREEYQENLKKCKHPELRSLIKKTYHENNKAFDVAISALEKQIPKKPYKVNEHKQNDYYCTVCRRYLGDEMELKYACLQPEYCQHCGQALDWSDTE